MDDATCCGGGPPQTLVIIQISPMDTDAPGPQRRGSSLRSGKSDDLVARRGEFTAHSRSDVPGGTGDKYVHERVAS